jgi:hypothetical protein
MSVRRTFAAPPERSRARRRPARAAAAPPIAAARRLRAGAPHGASTGEQARGREAGMIPRQSTSWLLAAVVLAAAVVAPAAPATASDGRGREAREAFAAGRYQDALDAFARLYAEQRHPNYLWNIARCYQNLGEPVAAIRNFREYLRAAKEVTPDERRTVDRYIAEMEELLRRHAGDPAAAPDAARTAPAAAPEGAGAPSPRAAPAAAPIAAAPPVVAAAGAVVAPVAPLSLRLVAAPAPAVVAPAAAAVPAPRPAGKAARLTPLRIAGLATGAASVLALAGGTLSAVQALSSKRDYESQPGCALDCPALRNANAAADRATALALLGTALAGGAVALYVFGAADERRAGGGEGTPVQVTALPAPAGWSIALRGSYGR